jgi:CubicO group peptidase (beta-lactamase class C family)
MTRDPVHAWGLGVVAAVVLAASAVPETAPQRQAAGVDEAFARWTRETPGCAVGVGVGGQSVLERAYGMADLEHDVPNTPDTVFEAGSVSKQFTAAAVLLLVVDGKIQLDDRVRTYIPELPDYGMPLTVRHMLTHTSGLRDWGSLAGIAGWPRGDRVHTHDHVVDILSRQKALNFTPGTRWSYSNSGYNLSAVLVDRVSGMSFAEFSRTRLFEPLGLTSTTWRDDYTRIVPKRAVAYASGRGGGYRMDMPFENVHGNGGLLTTVSDLLRWNAALDAGTLAGPAFAAEQQQPGTLADGRPIRYAMGLYTDVWKGVREVEGFTWDAAAERVRAVYAEVCHA